MLSGGTGSRLRPITHTSAKQLVPVANKPVLFYGIEALRDAGIREIGIIVGDTAAEIKEAVGDGSQWGVKVTYIAQEAPLGLAHAVLTAAEFLGDSQFVMYLGDNLLRDGISDLVEAFIQNGPDALILLQKVPNPEAYGVAECRDGAVVKLVEKPAEPKSDLALVGVYMFTPAILECARAIKPSPRGELEITDAIQCLIDMKKRVEPHVVQGWWKDTGKLEDMLEANRLILDVLKTDIAGDVENSEIHGRVVIEAGARISNCTIRGPVIIGERTVVHDCYIGPYTSVYYDCELRNSEIEHSIILEQSRVLDLRARMEGSLIGKNVRIARLDHKPKAYRFMVGDNSWIGIV
ncbi:MAG: glucose-1-phosphate thymidylyltransferase [Thermoleophilia bacterium]|nr:glucose-1-phosphate thymidylyltransferase [Thermoleophilia bacterium]